MRYLMPNFPCEFEIPDDWIMRARALMTKTPARPFFLEMFLRFFEQPAWTLVRSLCVRTRRNKITKERL